jgi:hypothetical protein
MPIKIGNFSLIQADKGETPNPCGSCTVCCTVLSIDDGDFHKPSFTPCSHICEQGCDIYSSKPSICTGFYCMYAVLADFFRDDDRPDKSGIVIAINHPDSHFTQTTKLTTFSAYEARPGAFKSYNGDRMLRKISSKVVLILIPNEKNIAEVMIDDNTVFLSPSRDRSTITKYLSLYKGIAKERNGTNNNSR